MDNVKEFMEKMGICDEGSIIADDDYETSQELESVSDLLKQLGEGDTNGEE